MPTSTILIILMTLPYHREYQAKPNAVRQNSKPLGLAITGGNAYVEVSVFTIMAFTQQGSHWSNVHVSP